MRSANSIVFNLDGRGVPKPGSHSTDFVKFAEPVAGQASTAPQSAPQPAVQSKQPNWATSRGQANWQRKFQAADARTRQQMLGNLKTMAGGMSGDQLKQFQSVAQRMNAYAKTFDRPAPKGMKQYAPGVYGSSMDEIRAANTPEKIQQRQQQRAELQRSNPYINSLNPNGIGPMYNGRLFTRPPVATPRYRGYW